MFSLAFVTLITLVLLYIILHFQDFSLIFVKSSKDNEYHLVRNLPDRKKAADKMAEIKMRIQKLIDYLSEKYPQDDRVKRLKERYEPDAVQETRLDSAYTSFSVDKGEEMHLCLRDKKMDNYNIHDINTLMFVALHELSHLASVNKGHDGEFNNNFVWILKYAVQIGIWESVDYSNSPVDFCGERITNNPLISSMRIMKN